MLLFALLENGLLKRERGDVVVFNNTACEHPETYKFVAECKRRVESQYDIPFFFVEFQTYEDAANGEWSRLQSYRLVNSEPYSEDNPDGFHWKGEVFEELLSYKAYLPNQFRRTCTATLKLEATRLFLRDWFASKPSIAFLGHGMAESLVDHDEMYRRHRRSRGGVPRDILIKKKSYVFNRPTFRPKQKYADFSSSAQLFENKTVSPHVYGRKAKFGEGGIEYVAFIGLRGDEHLRTARVEARKTDPHANAGYEGEHVYMPLAKMDVAREDVNEFWDQQGWGLNLPESGELSNCVYCFLKGASNLASVHHQMQTHESQSFDGFGTVKGTPCDIDWWARVENDYGRDLEAEKRERKNMDGSGIIGFFGHDSKFSYDVLADISADKEQVGEFAKTILPCDCTE